MGHVEFSCAAATLIFHRIGLVRRKPFSTMLMHYTALLIVAALVGPILVRNSDIKFVVCGDCDNTRHLVADVLDGAGYIKASFAQDGLDLLRLTEQHKPRVVITASRIPQVSGLDFTRKIRAGHEDVNRATSIIVMTDTPTHAFLAAARAAGVDEMMVMPFNRPGLLARIEAVLLRPRRFIESGNYTGPCRRRRMLEDYGGPMRRSDEQLLIVDCPAWEAEANRALMRDCVEKVATTAAAIASAEVVQVDKLGAAVRDAKMLADELDDKDTIKSIGALGRYLRAAGTAGVFDPTVLNVFLHALRQLCNLGSGQSEMRAEIARGLSLLVDKRLAASEKAGTHAA